MPINLNAPMAWTEAAPDEIALLADLQCNILKGHGRRSTRHLFLRFRRDAYAARAFVRTMSTFIVSAHEQLRQAEAFKTAGISGPALVGFFLTFRGYQALGIEARAPSSDAGATAFREGMRARGGEFGDPDPELLEADYQQEIHAKILIAANPDSDHSWGSSEAEMMETRILNLMGDAAEVVASEEGRAIFDDAGEGLEHFGYVDGRSQPLFLTEDIARENGMFGGDQWDPAFPLKQVLVKDPGSPLATAFGSYFVFRKLEQDVRGFKAAEEELGEDAGNDELAGATIVGRWENGTSVLLSGDGEDPNPINNNFNYLADPDGAKCPLHAHVRKTNPRGDSERLGASLDSEQSHLMARRGITYGRRNRVTGPTDKPSHGVGLLFMAYQSDLSHQFEFTQGSWAENEGFVAPGTGIDPIIAQGEPSLLRHPRVWNEPTAGFVEKPFGGFVTLKGGEYFFAPSKSMLGLV